MKLDDVLKGSYQRYIAADFLSTVFFNKRIPLVIDGVEKSNANDIKKKLLDVYGDTELTVEKDGEDKCVLASQISGDEDVIIAPSVALVDCKRFDFSDLEQIMHRLRADDGCEWDRAQTHESIRINLIEEAYELVDAIDRKDADDMKEECGDVLMQAVFHAEIAQKEGDFGYMDMITGLCRKLIDRHTHIFGSNHANNADEALVFWEAAKKKEKHYKSASDQMERVPKNFPALLYAEKIQKYAKKAGFDWDDVSGAYQKIAEETEELKTAGDAHRVEEGGDLLFAVVNALRFYKVEPELALSEANKKFVRRFTAVENAVKASGKDMKDCSLDELDAIWNRVKQQEKQNDKQ